MPILNRDEFMSRLQSYIGEDTSDETVSFIEDVTDTFNDLESRTVDNSGEWEEKYNQLSAEKDELDKSWRERYKARFFDGIKDGEEAKEDHEEDVKRDGEEVSFEDLFEEREG